jgi:hypothetical protein
MVGLLKKRNNTMNTQEIINELNADNAQMRGAINRALKYFGDGFNGCEVNTLDPDERKWALDMQRELGALESSIKSNSVIEPCLAGS